jgi:hypothetical protein
MEGLSRKESEHGREGFLEDMEVEGRRIGIKASRPHVVVSSLFSTLSDGLRESCVSVTKLAFASRLFSLVSSLALVHVLSLALIRNGESSIDPYLQ